MRSLGRRGGAGWSVVVAALCAASVAVSGQPAPMLKAGLFLYAKPGMTDPRFAETIVLLLRHGSDGSMGVVINRPTEVPLYRALRDVDEAQRSDVFLYWGGPVQPDAVQALLRSHDVGLRTQVVVPNVLLTSDLDVLRRALGEPRAPHMVRVYSGYAGWSPGQLAGEVRRGDWVLDQGTAEPVFAPDASVLWRRVRVLMDRRQAGDSPGHLLDGWSGPGPIPSMNGWSGPGPSPSMNAPGADWTGSRARGPHRR